MSDPMTFEQFNRHVGSSFVLRGCEDDAGSAELELIEATSLGRGDERRDESHRREPFSLVFRGPAELVLPQAIYRLTHDELGDQEMFLVPIGPDAQGMRYEAIFN